MGGHEEGHDGMIAAAGMEVVQVERVVLDLAQVGRRMPGGAVLPFKHDDGAVGQENGVDAFLQSQQVVLQEVGPSTEIEHHVVALVVAEGVAALKRNGSADGGVGDAFEVGEVAAARRGRRTHAERLALALDLLRDPAFDVLLTGESRFEDLPDVMAELAEGATRTLCRSIIYPDSAAGEE